MIGLVDYGMGNLRSVAKAIEASGGRVRPVTTPEELDGVAGVVLPGVGAFADAMAALTERGLAEPLRELTRAAAAGEGRPYLGVCLGLQLLFEASEEADHTVAGLGALPGRVLRFDPAPGEDGRRLRVPHMGWNEIRVHRDDPLLAGVDDGAHVYFLHSFYAVPERDDDVLTTTDYPRPFCSAVARGKLRATQFHPEKSQAVGRHILANFVRLVSDE